MCWLWWWYRYHPQLILTSDSLKGFLNRARGLQKRKPTLPSQRWCSRHDSKATFQGNIAETHTFFQSGLNYVEVCILWLWYFAISYHDFPNGFLNRLPGGDFWLSSNQFPNKPSFQPLSFHGKLCLIGLITDHVPCVFETFWIMKTFPR